MKVLILSYNPGMFGEFIATKIVESNTKFASNKETKTTPENRFLYPNYLFPINIDCKNLPAESKWLISEKDISILNSHYSDKTICLPTHWYSNNIEQSNLPSHGIAMFSTNLSIIKLAYSLFWIKSHVFANNPWELRAKELQSMIDNNHPYAKDLRNLQTEGNYRNWKFLSYKYGFLKDGQTDLYHYMCSSFTFYKRNNLQLCTASADWFRFDIGNAIHSNQKNISLLEEHLGIALNRQQISEYATKNLTIIKDKLGFTLDDLSSDGWLDTLYDYCKSEMQD
jgi:hypothetical protein